MENQDSVAAESRGRKPKNPAPPYISPKSFFGIIAHFKKTIPPARIDNSVVSHLSGTMQSQLKSALRFLKLTTENEAVTDTFRALVSSYQTDQWVKQLTSVIEDAYAPITAGLDITTTTINELQGRFREHGSVEGDTVGKCIRFYLAILKEANVSFSPHLIIRKKNPPRKRIRQTIRKSDAENVSQDTLANQPSDTSQPEISPYEQNKVSTPVPVGAGQVWTLKHDKEYSESDVKRFIKIVEIVLLEGRQEKRRREEAASVIGERADE